MANTSGLEVKREITKALPRGAECRSMLSGFVRSCMSLSVTRGGVTLELDCQTDFVREYIAGAMQTMFGAVAEELEQKLVYGDCEKLLVELRITSGS
ncbi:MAG: hypothetical protein K2L88_02125, partial [Clostridiales bacterium]|nr:hypothetical protein [Clostridiales bacterium]